jgi:hypothetical protein
MTSRNVSTIGTLKTSQLVGTAPAEDAGEGASEGAKPMTSILRTICAVLALATISLAAELPEAPSSAIRTDAAMIGATTSAPRLVTASPEVYTIDKTFVSVAFVSTGSTFADSYTTLFARQNWLAGKKGVCNMEAQAAYLYGTHPTVGRAYAVASVKSASAIFAAYYLRKHHSRLWALPLVANTGISLEGVTQNMIGCN